MCHNDCDILMIQKKLARKSGSHSLTDTVHKGKWLENISLILRGFYFFFPPCRRIQSLTDSGEVRERDCESPSHNWTSGWPHWKKCKGEKTNVEFVIRIRFKITSQFEDSFMFLESMMYWKKALHVCLFVCLMVHLHMPFYPFDECIFL